MKSTFTKIVYEQVDCIVDYMYSDKALCYVFSLPFGFDCLERIGNNFPSIAFNNVTYLWVCDTISFEHEFFVRIARAFPLLRKFHIMNRLSQLSNLTEFQSDINHSYSMVDYPHVCTY